MYELRRRAVLERPEIDAAPVLFEVQIPVLEQLFLDSLPGDPLPLLSRLVHRFESSRERCLINLSTGGGGVVRYASSRAKHDLHEAIEPRGSAQSIQVVWTGTFASAGSMH